MEDNNKNRLLLLLNYLYKNTDDKHVASVSEIIKMLGNHNINSNRNTIRDDVKALNTAGYEILSAVGPNNSKLYHYGSRPFDQVEIKLLVDAVSSSKFIGAKKSQEIIEKLCGLTSIYEANKIIEQSNIAERIKTDNPKLLYIVDVINTAIDKRKKIKFQYMEYDAKKELVYKNNGEWYVNSPYAMIWSDDRYYLQGYSDKHDKVVLFRIDRMCMPEILDEPCEPKREDFSSIDYVNKSFQMYSGEECLVTIECPNQLMKQIIDKFGDEICVKNISEESFQTTVAVNVSKTFFGWLCMYAGEIKIVSPSEIKEAYKNHLEKALNYER